MDTIDTSQIESGMEHKLAQSTARAAEAGVSTIGAVDGAKIVEQASIMMDTLGKGSGIKAVVEALGAMRAQAPGQ